MIDPSIPLQANAGPAPLNPVQTLAGIGQIRAQQQEGALRDQQLEVNARNLDANKRAQVEDQRLREIFAKGIPTAGELYSTVGPVRGNEILKGLAAMRTEQLKSSNEIKTAVGSMAGGILALPPTMQEDAYKMARQNLLTRGAQPEDIPEQFPGPEGLKQFQVWAQTPEQQITTAETARGNAVKEAQTAATAAQTAADKAADNARADKAATETNRHNLASEAAAAARAKAGAASAADVTNLTPEGLDAAALNYAKTGVMPALGMGDKNTRKEIINRAAAMMPGLDIASAKADFTANQESLKTMQKQRDAITSFEQTASKNIDLFLSVAGKVVDAGSPLANRPLRAITGALFGSEDQATYDAARQVAINEIAKITSNPTLAGQLSDSARHEVEAFNPQGSTLKQTVAVMRLLKTDMANRTAALDDTLGGIKARIKKGSGQPDTGRTRVVGPNGESGTVPAGTSLPAGWKAAP